MDAVLDLLERLGGAGDEDDVSAGRGQRLGGFRADAAAGAGDERDAGASEVHFRVASPPTGHGCYYGVDTPERSKLLAGRMDVAAMCEFIRADSLAFVSIDGLYRAVDLPGRDNARPQYCDACFTGDYPTRLSDIEGELGGLQLSLLLEDA